MCVCVSCFRGAKIGNDFLPIMAHFDMPVLEINLNWHKPSAPVLLCGCCAISTKNGPMNRNSYWE